MVSITRSSWYTRFLSLNRAPNLKNVTIPLDEEPAAWARVYAATHNMSVSRLVGEMLQQRMGELHEYDRAMRAYLAKPPLKLRRTGAPYPKRDELYDRGRRR